MSFSADCMFCQAKIYSPVNRDGWYAVQKKHIEECSVTMRKQLKDQHSEILKQAREIDRLKDEVERFNDGSKGIAYESHLEHQLIALRAENGRYKNALEQLEVWEKSLMIRYFIWDGKSSADITVAKLISAALREGETGEFDSYKCDHGGNGWCSICGVMK